jgi:hypothetical protein
MAQRSNLIVGTLAALAAMAYVTLRQRLHDRRLAAQPIHEITWEGEGGNVPEVALENGNQGRSARIEPPPHASELSDGREFEFPRAS